MAEAWSAVPEWLRCYPCCIHKPELPLKPSSLQLRRGWIWAQLGHSPMAARWRSCFNTGGGYCGRIWSAKRV